MSVIPTTILPSHFGGFLGDQVLCHLFSCIPFLSCYSNILHACVDLSLKFLMVNLCTFDSKPLPPRSILPTCKFHQFVSKLSSHKEDHCWWSNFVTLTSYTIVAVISCGCHPHPSFTFSFWRVSGWSNIVSSTFMHAFIFILF